MTLTIYHNPRCSKSRTTLALLEERDLKPRIVEYLKTPPTAAELKDIIKKLGVSPRDIVRKAEAAEAKVDINKLSDDQLIAAMVKHPEIIERPIVLNKGKAALGRPPEQVLKIL